METESENSAEQRLKLSITFSMFCWNKIWKAILKPALTLVPVICYKYLNVQVKLDFTKYCVWICYTYFQEEMWTIIFSHGFFSPSPLCSVKIKAVSLRLNVELYFCTSISPVLCVPAADLLSCEKHVSVLLLNGCDELKDDGKILPRLILWWAGNTSAQRQKLFFPRHKHVLMLQNL